MPNLSSLYTLFHFVIYNSVKKAHRPDTLDENDVYGFVESHYR